MESLFDINVEAWMAECFLGNPSMPFDSILIQLQGQHHRLSSNECDAIIHSESNDYDGSAQKYTIGVHRKGLFDHLPEGLFVDSDISKYPNAIAAAQAIEEQRAAARQFFSPFEQAIYEWRIQAAVLKKQQIENSVFLEHFWDLKAHSDDSSPEQRRQLCYFIPKAAQMIGNWELTAQLFETLIQHPVRIKPIAPLMQMTPNSFKTLENINLDRNDYYNGMFQDDTPAIEVTISEVLNDELMDFLEGKSRNLLEKVLYHYFLPFESQVVTRIEVKSNEIAKTTFATAILDYNIQLE
jgi:hypothetical protein